MPLRLLLDEAGIEVEVAAFVDHGVDERQHPMLDVATVPVSGVVNVGGATPKNGPDCFEYPSVTTGPFFLAWNGRRVDP